MSAEGINYMAVIADLKAKRAALDQAIAALEQWHGLGGGEDSPITANENRQEQSQRPEPTEIRSDTFFGLSIPDAIRKCFRISKRPLSLSEMTNSLKAGGLLTTAANLMATVSATLQRMKQQSGEVVALGKGQWGLAEWYPGLRKEKVEAAAKPKKTRKRGRSKGNFVKVEAKRENEKSPPLKVTPEQIEQMQRLHEVGKTFGEISKELHIPTLTVWRTLSPKSPKDTQKAG